MTFPQRLIDGYNVFYDTRLPTEQTRYRALAESGQRPEIMVISCADSRVSPEVIFDARPGELFVVRNVANLVPPYSPDQHMHGVSAALEFAMQALEVKHVVVLGHGRCGGIRAFVTQEVPLSSSDFIGRWMSMIAPAAESLGPRGARTLDEYLAALERQSAVTTLENLMTFPFVRQRVEKSAVTLHAAFFEVASGIMSVCDPQTRNFIPVVPTD